MNNVWSMAYKSWEVLCKLIVAKLKARKVYDQHEVGNCKSIWVELFAD